MNSCLLFEFIDKLRKKRGWTFYKLSKNAGISQGTLYTWRKRGTLPSLYVLESLCNALDISLSNFFAMIYDENDVSAEDIQLLSSWKMLSVPQKDAIKNAISAFLLREN